MKLRIAIIFMVAATAAAIQPGKLVLPLYAAPGTVQEQAVVDPLPFGLTNTPAALVGHEEATRQIAERYAAMQTLLGEPPSGTRGVAPATAAAQTNLKEIVELARALKNDPDLFYEYVHGIATLPISGSLKGPLGTLLDRSGTAFDQAELLYLLLQQAGYAPSFQIGVIRRSAEQLTNWLGTDPSPSAVERVLTRGGFAAAITATPAGTVDYATISWAWVSVQIDNVEYMFDPATKEYDHQPMPADLGEILHYNRTAFLNAVTNGASITPTTVTGINRTALHANLLPLANNLKAYLASDGALLSAEAVMGGKTVRRLPLNTRLRQTSLPYSVGIPSPAATMPDMFRTVVWVALPATSTVSFLKLFSSDIYGRSVTIFFDASLRPAIRVDGVVPSGNGATGVVHIAGSPVPITIGVFHPYPSVAGRTCKLTAHFRLGNGYQTHDVTLTNTSAADQCGVLTVQAGSTLNPGKFALLAGFGGASRGVIEKRRMMLDDATVNNDPTTVAVLGESLSMQGFDWFAQLTRLAEMADGMLGTSTVFHHAIGIIGIRAVGSSVGPYLDLPMVKAGFVQRTGDPGLSMVSTQRETSALFAAAGWLSVLESGVIEQTQPTHTAVSTVSIIDRVMATDLVYDINNSSIPGSTPASYHSGIRPQLAKTYAPSDLARIDALVAAGRRVIAPRSGAVSIDQWTGVGYFSIAQNGAESSIGALITGGMSGGFVTRPVPIPAFNINSLFTFEPDSRSNLHTAFSIGPAGNAADKPIGGDPVNLPTGHYVYDRTHLKTGGGEFPYALEFIPSIDTGRGQRKGPLGHGWIHNFEASAQKDSDGFEGLGLNSPISGVAAIVATYVVQDLMNAVATKPLDTILIAAGVQQWAMDEMTNNVVTITQPGNTEHFVKLPDGTYHPPLGSASTLVNNAGGGYTFTAKDRTQLTFDADGKLTTYATSKGVSIAFAYNGSNRLTSVTNSLGRRLSFAYSGDLISTVTTDGDSSIALTYDGDSNLSTVTDVSGMMTRYTYAKRGQLRQIFLPSNPTVAALTNEFDGHDRVKVQTDALGNRTESFFAGSRTEIVNPDGKSRVYYFTSRGKVLFDTDETGQTTSTEYDHHDRVVRTTHPAGDSILYSYDSRHNVRSITHQPAPGSSAPASRRTFTYDPVTNSVLTETDENGRTTVMVYDGQGNLQSRIDPMKNVETMTYNTAGLVASITNALGHTEQRVYDSAGNPIRVIDALNRITVNTFDPSGRLLTRTDARGNSWRYAYDLRGRLISTTDPLGHVVSSVFDAEDRLVSVTNARGFTRRLEYNVGGLLVREIDEKGNIVEHAYDGLLRRIRTTDARGKQTTFGYDANGRQTSVTDPNGNTTQTVFDQNGNTASVIDAKGRTTQFVNDFGGRPLEIRNPLGHTVRKEYDPKGQVTREIDRFGRATSYVLDAAGRVTRITDAAGRTLELAYDPVGSRISQRDRNGQLWIAGYDAANQLQSISNPLGHSTNWSWDQAGNRLSRTDALGRTATYVHDAANRLIGVTYADGSAVSFTLDANGNVTQMVDALGTTRYEYDELDRVTLYIDPFGKQVGYRYDQNSNLIGLTYPDGKVVTYQYDAANRMTMVTDWTGRVIGLTHDSTDMLTRVQFPNGTTTTMTFADDDQLASRTDTPGISAYSLARDASTNMLSMAAQQPLEARPGSVARTFEVNGADHLLRAGDVPYEFNANGNNTRVGAGAGAIAFRYDHSDRLVANGSVLYAYNGLGVRLQTANGAAITRYVVDTSLDLARVLCETDGDGNITRYYLHGAGLLATVTPNDDAYYYHFDPSGSTIAITNGSGRIVNKYAYSPFGEILDSSEEIANPFAFSGELGLMKEANGLVYARARFYEPATGRFKNSDPSRNGIDGELSSNLFVYADADPVNRGDPSGLVTVSLGWSIALDLKLCPRCVSYSLGRSFQGTLSINSLSPSEWRFGYVDQKTVGGARFPAGYSFYSGPLLSVSPAESPEAFKGWDSEGSIGPLSFSNPLDLEKANYSLKLKRPGISRLGMNVDVPNSKSSESGTITHTTAHSATFGKVVDDYAWAIDRAMSAIGASQLGKGILNAWSSGPQGAKSSASSGVASSGSRGPKCC